MLPPVPTFEQVRDAILAAFNAIPSPPGVMLFAENKLPTDSELMNLYRDPVTKDVDLWVFSLNVKPKSGPASTEYYSIYNITLRYLCVKMNLPDESWAAIADTGAELVRTAIEGNDSVFAIGGQQPLLGTEKTVGKDGTFNNIDGDRFYETKLTLEVEARRWQ
jgi:hypothetical protein